MTKDEKIAKLGKEITDRATVLLGKDKITPDAPEYLGINSALKFTAVKYDEKMADDILDIALTMKKRVPLTIESSSRRRTRSSTERIWRRRCRRSARAAWSSSTGRTSTERTRTTPSAGCWICSFPAAPRS